LSVLRVRDAFDLEAEWLTSDIALRESIINVDDPVKEDEERGLSIEFHGSSGLSDRCVLVDQDLLREDQLHRGTSSEVVLGLKDELIFDINMVDLIIVGSDLSDGEATGNGLEVNAIKDLLDWGTKRVVDPVLERVRRVGLLGVAYLIHSDRDETKRVDIDHVDLADGEYASVFVEVVLRLRVQGSAKTLDLDDLTDVKLLRDVDLDT